MCAHISHGKASSSCIMSFLYAWLILMYVNWKKKKKHRYLCIFVHAGREHLFYIIMYISHQYARYQEMRLYSFSLSLSPFYHRDHHHQYYHKFPLHEKYISIYIYHCSSPVSLCFATLYRNIYIHSSVVYNNTTSMSMNRFATMVQKRYVFLSFCLNSVRDCGECRLCAVLCCAVCALCVILAS